MKVNLTKKKLAALSYLRVSYTAVFREVPSVRMFPSWEMEGGGRWFEAEAAGAGEAGVEVEEEVDRGPMAGEEEDSKGGDPEVRAADHGDQVLKVGW